MHTPIDTPQSTRTITEEEIVDEFQPVGELLWEVIEQARVLTEEAITAGAFPRLRRPAHLKRLTGSARWMHIADLLVERQDELPEGFSVESVEAQHNQGIYVLRFPGGVFTIKGAPHSSPEEGAYLQETLTGFEEVALAEGIDFGADLVVYLSVPAVREPKLIVTHPTLPKALGIGLERLRSPITVHEIDPSREVPRTTVRSSLRPAASDETTADGTTDGEGS